MTSKIRCVDWSVEKAEERIERGKNEKDPYILAFSQGCLHAEYMNEDLFTTQTKETSLFRGLGKSHMIWQCISEGIDYMYIDTGYFGNQYTKKYHRIAYNNLQTLNHINDKEIRKRFQDEFGEKWQLIYSMKKPILKFNIKRRPTNSSKKILIVPPSQKVFNHFGGDAGTYTKRLIQKIQQITNREVEVRKKLARSERVGYSLQDQLRSGKYHCMITFNSIASLESVSVGVPAIVLGPNAGSYLSETKLSNIENPYYPEHREIFSHLNYLNWCQFTNEEMKTEWCHRVIKCLQGDVEPGKFVISRDFTDD